jgi:hypothetical protein
MHTAGALRAVQPPALPIWVRSVFSAKFLFFENAMHGFKAALMPAGAAKCSLFLYAGAKGQIPLFSLYSKPPFCLWGNKGGVYAHCFFLMLLNVFFPEKRNRPSASCKSLSYSNNVQCCKEKIAHASDRGKPCGPSI